MRVRESGVWVANPASVPEASVTSLIASVTLASAAANIDVQNIPATYKHLNITAMLRTDRAGNASEELVMAINNNTTDADSDRQIMAYGVSTVVAAEAMGTAGSRRVGYATSATAAAGCFGLIEMFIPFYASTAFNKVVRTKSSLFFSFSSGGIYVSEIITGWESTAAINRLTISGVNSGNLIAGSTLTVHGVK